VSGVRQIPGLCEIKEPVDNVGGDDFTHPSVDPIDKPICDIVGIDLTGHIFHLFVFLSKMNFNPEISVKTVLGLSMARSRCRPIEK